MVEYFTRTIQEGQEGHRMQYRRVLQLLVSVCCGGWIGCGDSEETQVFVCSAWKAWCEGDEVWICLGDSHHTQLLETCTESQLCVDGQCLALSGVTPDVISMPDSSMPDVIPDVHNIPDSFAFDIDNLDSTTISDMGGTVDSTPEDVVDVVDPTDWGTVKPKDIAAEDPFPSNYPIAPPIWVEMWTDNSFFDAPWDIISLQDGRLAVADKHNFLIRIFDIQGNPLESWGWPDAEWLEFQPQVLYQDHEGVVWAQEVAALGRIVRFLPTGEVLSWWNPPETDAGGVNWYYHGIAVEKAGTVLCVDIENGLVVRFSADGKFLKLIAEESDEPGQLKGKPWGIRVAPDGTIVVATKGSLMFYSPDGVFLHEFNSAPEEPTLCAWWGMHFHNDYMYLAGGNANRLYLLDKSYNVVTAWGKGQGLDANKFRGAYGIAVGADERIYVADTWGYRIQVYQWAVPPP